MTTKRLFLGIPMQPAVNESIDNFIKQQQEHKGIRWVPEHNRHVTLLFLGNVEEYMLNKMVEQMEKVASSYANFTLEFDHFCISPKRNPYMVWARFKNDVTFEAICKQLSDKLNVMTDHHPLAHATLARFNNEFPYNTLMLDISAHIELKVNKFCLYESKLQVNGAEYAIMNEFILQKT